MKKLLFVISSALCVWQPAYSAGNVYSANQEFSNYSNNRYKFLPEETTVSDDVIIENGVCPSNLLYPQSMAKCQLKLDCNNPGQSPCEPWVQIKLREVDNSGNTIGEFIAKTYYSYDKQRDANYIKSFEILDNTTDSDINIIRKYVGPSATTSEVIINTQD